MQSLSLPRVPFWDNPIKPAYCFHFVQFTEWAPEALKNAELMFCSFGDDPFHGELENIVAGKTIGWRNIRVSHLKQLQDVCTAKSCMLCPLKREQARRDASARP